MAARKGAGHAWADAREQLQMSARAYGVAVKRQEEAVAEGRAVADESASVDAMADALDHAALEYAAACARRWMAERKLNRRG